MKTMKAVAARKKERMLIVVDRVNVSRGHRLYSGSGCHDNRLKRQRTRQAAWRIDQ